MRKADDVINAELARHFYGPVAAAVVDDKPFDNIYAR
jgi:hypothetical protein